MKKLLIVLVFTTLFFGYDARGQSFEVGNSAINLGIGFGGYHSVYNFGAPGFSVSYEYGAIPVGDGFGIIGFGAIGGIRTYKSNRIFGIYFDEEDVRYTTVGVGPRSTFHFTVIPVEKLDVYAVVQILFAFERTRYDDSDHLDDDDLDVEPNALAGARYFFSGNIAGFLEVGYGLTNVKTGISFKF